MECNSREKMTPDVDCMQDNISVEDIRKADTAIARILDSLRRSYAETDSARRRGRDLRMGC
jgi:hypothetical protein